MRSPEEVAREIRRLTWDVLGNDGLVEEDGPALADLIRARDAEVAEQVRAERDALFADNARLREGIEALAESVEGSDHTPGCGGGPTCAACWAADLDSLLHPNALLSTPTEGEPDA